MSTKITIDVDGKPALEFDIGAHIARCQPTELLPMVSDAALKAELVRRGYASDECAFDAGPWKQAPVWHSNPIGAALDLGRINQDEGGLLNETHRIELRTHPTPGGGLEYRILTPRA